MRECGVLFEHVLLYSRDSSFGTRFFSMFRQTLFKSRRDILQERMPFMTAIQLLSMKEAYESRLAFMDNYARYVNMAMLSYVLFLLIRSATMARLSSVNRMLVTAMGCVMMCRVENFREERGRLREEAGLIEVEVSRRASR